MKNKRYFLAICLTLLLSPAFAGEVNISSLDELVRYSSLSGNTITMKSGVYRLTGYLNTDYVSYSWMPGIEPADQIIELSDLLRAYPKDQEMIYLDYYSLMVNGNKGLKKSFGHNTVHPSKEGYQVISPLVRAVIKKVLSR